MIKFILFVPLALLGCVTSNQNAKPVTKSIVGSLTGRPLIIAHRGASGELPEHTLEAYRLAIEQGADFIEPDLVCTKDKVLVARHENEIGETTDVAVKFPSRKAKKTIDGQTEEGFFVEDFTLAEIKTLRARQRLKFRNQEYNGKYQIPTFSEILNLRKQMSAVMGRPVGVYPETKHPTYHETTLGCPISQLLVKDLQEHGLDNFEAPVFVQSFEVSNLETMRRASRVKLVQLIDSAENQPYDLKLKGDRRTYGDLISPGGLRRLAKTVNGIGPWKRLIVPEDKSGELLKPTDLVERAHELGLVVHAWTFRNDPSYLAKPYGGDPAKEYLQFRALKLDGLFTDFPKSAVSALGI